MRVTEFYSAFPRKLRHRFPAGFETYTESAMRPILSLVLPSVCSLALAQVPAGQQAPGNPLQPSAGATAGVGLPAPGPPVELNFDQALARARQYNLAFLNANLAALIAHEDAVQAKAALLPTANWFNQYIYTQPNDTATVAFCGQMAWFRHANRSTRPRCRGSLPTS